MKKKEILFILFVAVFGCKSHKILYKTTVVDGIVMLSYEKSGKEGRYYGKSKKIIINNKYYDLIGWVPENSKLGLLLEKREITNQSAKSKCAIFSEDGDIYFSDHLYYWLNDEDDLAIIFSIKGSVLIINELPKDRKYGLYNHYSCPVVIDTVNAPFCKIINIDSCFLTNRNWTNDNLYFKTKNNTFKVAFCD